MSSPPSTRDDWISAESSILEILVRELQRFKERMKMHPVPVLLLAAILSAGAVFNFTRKPPIYTARIILRISEGALSEYRGSLMPRRELQNYIYSFSLTDQLLLSEIIEKHNLFQEEMELKGASLAIAELRDGLSLDVFYNFFHYNQNYERTPRSLRLAVEYMHQDPEFAYQLALLLAEMVIRVESQKRLDEVRFASDNAHAILRAARADHAERERQLATLSDTLKRHGKLVDGPPGARAGPIEGAPAARPSANASPSGDAPADPADPDSPAAVALAEVEYETLSARHRQAELALEFLQGDVERIDFARRIEEEKMGLVFEYAGQVRPIAIPPPGPVMLGLMGLICFCIFVPVCAIGIGTINSRVQNLEDVSRLGLPVIGHVPAFKGDNKGSLKHRGALKRPGRWPFSTTTRARRVHRPSG